MKFSQSYPEYKDDELRFRMGIRQNQQAFVMLKLQISEENIDEKRFSHAMVSDSKIISRVNNMQHILF